LGGIDINHEGGITEVREILTVYSRVDRAER
jgi:hypothetical protein